MPTTMDMFNMVLGLLDREDRLVNSRMTWYLTIQGFIVAGVALSLTGRFESHSSLQTPGIVALSILGTGISVIVFIAVLRARRAKSDARDKWEKFESDEKDSFPDPTGERGRLSFLTPGQTVPIIFVLFWVAAIIGVCAT